MKKLLLLCLGTSALLGCNSGSANGTPNNTFIGGGSCLATSLQWANSTLYSSCLPQANYWNQNNYNTLLSTSAQANNNWNTIVQDQTGSIDGYTVDAANGNYYPYALNFNNTGNTIAPTWIYNSSGTQIGSDGIDNASVEDVMGGYYSNALVAYNNNLYFGGVIGGSIWSTNSSNSTSVWTNTSLTSPYNGASSLTIDPTSNTLYFLGNCGIVHYYSNGIWQAYNDATIQNNPAIGIGGTACTNPLSSSAFATSLSVANGNLYILLSNQNGGQSYLYSIQEANKSATMSQVTSIQPGFSGNTYTTMTVDDNNHLWAAQVIDNNYDMQAVEIY